MSEAGDRVYQTRVVSQTPGIQDSARNVFADPDEAKEYLEGYVEIRFEAKPGDWRREQSADEKWSMYPDGFEGRAVVMGVPLRRNDVDDLLEQTQEIVDQLGAGLA
jgi:hypothetical protein